MAKILNAVAKKHIATTNDNGIIDNLILHFLSKYKQ